MHTRDISSFICLHRLIYNITACIHAFKSCMSPGTETKVQLYRTYIIPVLLFGYEIWTITRTLEKRLDAFATWCLRKILRILYTRHTTNETVRSITGCLPVSDRVKSFCLRFFGHLARSAPEEDHHRVIAAALSLDGTIAGEATMLSTQSRSRYR